MCLRLEASGEIEAIRASLRPEPDDAGVRDPSVIESAVPDFRFDQRIEDPNPAVLTPIR